MLLHPENDREKWQKPRQTRIQYKKKKKLEVIPTK
jgi:hypothetical protein